MSGKMDKKKTIICYGDSNTYGYDPRAGSGGRYSKSWTEILKKKLNCEVENHGICGRCIPHTPSQLKFACEQLNDWKERDGSLKMWIMLGTNDLLQEENYTAEYAANRMDFFLRLLIEQDAVRSNKIQLVLIAPPKMEYGSWVEEERIYNESRKLGDEYQRVARKLGIAFVDAGKWDIPVVFDGVHFSEEGHREFANNILNALF